MATPFAFDLNNKEPGTFFIRNMLDQRKSQGVRTHYYKSGINTANSLHDEADSVPHQEFPGTDIPLESVRIRKFDGGRGVRVDRYKYRDRNPLAYSIRPDFPNTAWYDLCKTELADVLKPQSAPWGNLPGDDDEDPEDPEEAACRRVDNTDQQIFVPTLTYALMFPFETTTPPLNASVASMVNKVNSNPFDPFGINGSPLPRGSFVFTPPTIDTHIQEDGSLIFRGTYVYLYRYLRALPDPDGEGEVGRPGWTRMIRRKDANYQLILEYPEAVFTNLEEIVDL